MKKGSEEPQIIYMSLKEAEAAYDKYNDNLKKLWAIVVYKNGYAAITLRSELKNIMPSTNKGEDMNQQNHPCLCDICLKARDSEIVRVIISQKQEIIAEVKKMKKEIQWTGNIMRDTLDNGEANGFNKAISAFLKLFEPKRGRI